MSLINEALKRTRDASYQPTVADLQPVLKPTARPTPAASARRTRIIVSSAFCVLALGMLAFVTWQFSSMRPRQRLDYMPATSTPPPPGIEGLPAPVREAIKAAPPTAPAPVDAKAIEEQVTAKVLEKIKAEVPPTPPAEPVVARELPELKVEGFQTIGGVRYAMINGQTVREGAVVEGAKVLAIERPVVRVQFDGREFTLRL